MNDAAGQRRRRLSQQRLLSGAVGGLIEHHEGQVLEVGVGWGEGFYRQSIELGRFNLVAATRGR